MWKKTNYPAQVEMLKEAGLNPGLIYGSAGAGGSTSAGSGGSAASGSAAAPMDIGAALQMALLPAQKKLLEAQAEKTKAEAEKVGTDKQLSEKQIENLSQGIENQKAQQELIKVQTQMQEILTDIQNSTKDYQKFESFYNVKKLIEEVKQIGLQNNVNQATIDSKIEIIRNEAAATELENILKSVNIEKTETETKAIAQGILQKWKEIYLRGDEIEVKKQDTQTKMFEAEIKAEYPGIQNAVGKIVAATHGKFEELMEYLFNSQPYRRRVPR
jgi:uncharacterized protein (DUF3084 family)